MTWATSVPIFGLPIGLSVLDLDPMYATDWTDRCQTKASINTPPIRGWGININTGGPP